MVSLYMNLYVYLYYRNSQNELKCKNVIYSCASLLNDVCRKMIIYYKRNAEEENAQLCTFFKLVKTPKSSSLKSNFTQAESFFCKQKVKILKKNEQISLSKKFK